MVESQTNIEPKKQPLFRDINADDEIPEISEIESLCMQCQENGTTRILLTRIPFFKEIVIMSFECPHCHHKDNQIQPSSQIQEKGVRLILKVHGKKIMNRQVVKQNSASFRIVELDFESPAFTSNGVLTTIEGMFENAIAGLEQQQPVRKIMNPEIAEKIDDVIQELNKYKSGEIPFTLIIDDCSGNSFIENPNAPDPDPLLTEEYYERTVEQNEQLGIQTPENDADVSSTLPDSKETEIDEKEDLKNEVLEFPSNCHSCQTPVSTKMKVLDIPFFKEVVIMATSCDACGFRESDVKPGGAIEEKGRRIKLRMTDKSDLTRDVLTSETCEVRIPDLDLELSHSRTGGKFTTVEGLLVYLKDQLGKVNPFSFGDSSKANRMKDIVGEMEKAIEGKRFFTIVLDDPVGNSYIQNFYAPDDDPEMSVELYERSEEQNIELGIADLKTEGYEENT